MIIYSPYQRARETAEPTIKAFPNAAVEEWPIQELTYLSAQKLGYSNREQRKPLRDAYWEKLDPDYRDGEDAESFSQFIGRVRNFITKLTELPENWNIAVFTHEQFIKAVQLLKDHPEETDNKKLMKLFGDSLKEQRIENAEIIKTRLDRDGHIQPMETVFHPPPETIPTSSDRQIVQKMTEHIARENAWMADRLEKDLSHALRQRDRKNNQQSKKDRTP